jgi:hypothetical protein
MSESAKPIKIKPIAPLDVIGGDMSDIAKATKPIMPPVSMATTITTAEETTHFVNEGQGLPTVPMNASIGNSEVTTEIPTGPLPFNNNRSKELQSVSISHDGKPSVTFVPTINEDLKFGKAFNIAKSTVSSFKVETIEAFINLVEKIKENI